jgi:hypothetical protein
LTLFAQSAQLRAIAQRRTKEAKMPDELNAVSGLPDEAVLTEQQTARLLNISLDTLKRLDQAGNGPPTVWLSRRRKGRPLGGIRQWLKARTITGNAA